MTSLKFTKTRIVYWDSGVSSLKLPKDANTLPPEVTLLAEDSALPYRVAKVVGKDKTNPSTGHQWHIVPYNHYGLYCTPSEINALYENSNSITPTSMSFTVGHCIPLTRNATTNSTQLSFNNTIYSLIVDLPTNDHVSPGDDFVDDANFRNFTRTFDGAKYDDLTRNLLPIPDIYFKVPRVKNNPWVEQDIFDIKAKTVKDAIPNKDFITRPPGTYQVFSQNGAVNAYLPELLQDNTNVKVLYPGENQDSFHLSLSEYEQYATIPTDSINFNETFANLDCRASLINSSAPFPGDLYSLMTVVPVMRGPRSLFASDISDSPYASVDDTKGTAAQRLSRTLWSAIMQSKSGMRHLDTFTKGLPQKFIKCLPILANDDTPVNHTICATITWTLEVTTTARLYKNINPLKWEMLWPYRYIIRNYDDKGIATSVNFRETMISSNGLRPLNDAHYRDLQIRRRTTKQLDPSDDTNYNDNSYQPSITTVNTLSESIPINGEQDAGYYTNAAYNDLHTAVFNTGTAVQTRSKTRKNAK